jgi:hypothetical protein
MQLGFNTDNKAIVTANNMNQMDSHGDREDRAIGLLPMTSGSCVMNSEQRSKLRCEGHHVRTYGSTCISSEQ